MSDRDQEREALRDVVSPSEEPRRQQVERGGSYADASPQRKQVADALRGFSKEVDDPLGQLALADRVLAVLAREDTERPESEQERLAHLRCRCGTAIAVDCPEHGGGI